MSKIYWDAYLHLGDRSRVSRSLRNLSNINGLVADLRDGISALRQGYQQAWLAENRPYWLENVLVRYDMELTYWAGLQKRLLEYQRHFNETSTLPSPEELGFFTK
jgi:hypothetical protein